MSVSLPLKCFLLGDPCSIHFLPPWCTLLEEKNLLSPKTRGLSYIKNDFEMHDADAGSSGALWKPLVPDSKMSNCAKSE